MRIATRMLAKRPGFAAVIVLTLALGIGANTMIFTVVNAYLLHPLPFADADRLAAVSDVQPHHILTPASWPELQRWREGNQVFDGIIASFHQNRNLAGRRGPARVRAALVSQNFFGLLGTQPVAGRGFAPGEHKPGAVPVAAISTELAAREFGGDRNAIGQKITLDRTAYTVAGVFDAAPLRFGSARTDEVWLPIERQPPYTAEGLHYLFVIGRMKAGVSVEQARASLEALGKHNDHGVTAGPLRESLFGDVRPSLLLLLGAAGFLLLIAAANVGNILLARASSRTKEFAVRTALGAGRWRLIRQTLVESLVLAAAGGVLGLLVSEWGTGLLGAFLPSTMARPSEFDLDWRVAAFLAGSTLLCAILFGLAPALQTSAISLGESLKEGWGQSSGASRSRLRSAFLISEIAVASVLLAGAGLLLQSFWRVMQVDPGFHAENVLTMSISLPAAKYSDDQKRIAFFDDLIGRIRALPGVTAAGAADHVPLEDGSINGDFRLADRPLFPPNESPVTEKYAATPDYFRAMGMRLVRGRWFNEQDGRRSGRVVIINESFARRFWPNENPIGKRMDLFYGSMEGWQEIVGVVGDIRREGLDRAVTLEGYLPYTQSPLDAMTLTVRTKGDPAQLASAVRSQVAELDPEQPVFNVKTMQQVVSDSLGERRLSTFLLALFAGLAMLLAAIGIYGVVSYWVSQRTREIGIRTALGAERGDILRLVFGRGMVLVGIGVAGGLAASLALTKFLASLLFGVSAHDALTMAAVPVTLGLIAVAACYVPARRAARVDPVVALRFE